MLTYKINVSLFAHILVSLFLQKSHFNSLTEECYSSQKTYRLLLSKYLISLRQANTKDMVGFWESWVVGGWVGVGGGVCGGEGRGGGGGFVINNIL